MYVLYVCLYICVCVRAWVRVCVYVCMCVCICTYIFMYMHLYNDPRYMYSVSHYVCHTVFCINVYYVTMVILMCYLYGASEKVTFVLLSDKFGFILLPILVIDLRSVIKSWNPLKVVWYNQKSHINLTVHYPLVLLASYIFSTVSWTMMDHVSLLTHTIHREKMSCYMR